MAGNFGRPRKSQNLFVQGRCASIPPRRVVCTGKKSQDLKETWLKADKTMNQTSKPRTQNPDSKTQPQSWRRHGGGRRHRRDAGQPGCRGRGLQSLSGGAGHLHRRGHGPVGQDLPHQRLFHLSDFPQAHRGGPASGHRDPDPGRNRAAGGRGGPFHRHPPPGTPLHRRGQVQRLRRLRRGLPGDAAVHF